ncbi:hypothetical protein FE257_002989 [Aspergillus nanangensis]|uniref:Fe2OG dioxygenase domain-containing protein n=1 Tax=Aspergillus nanangensis TaxID=2582783 RepID=A0AAD4CSR5_ASPNN|nr:hypothetical protein FE257_002989 [Aspergillus nanangensis]
MAEEFSSIPILDYGDVLSPTSKSTFLSTLRHALINVGFFYLRNPPIEVEAREALIQRSASFFNLPTAQKQEVALSNSKHFRGYASLGSEITGMKSDGRETFTVAFDSPAPGSDSPCYHNLIGPNQWPPESTIPGFRQAVNTYLHEVQSLADTFVILIAEALDIDPTIFIRLLEKTRYSIFRIAAYPCPEISTESGSQGVGPHKDGSFLTFLLQGTDHSSLEVQNKAGEWIAAPPIPDTLVVNIGRLLENLTQGVCVATTHRVILRPRQYCREDSDSDTSRGLRLSFPFFQSLGLDVSREDMQVELPDRIFSFRGDKQDMSDINAYLAEVYKGTIGESLLTSGIASHPDVGTRWYPELQAEILKREHEARQSDDLTPGGIEKA